MRNLRHQNTFLSEDNHVCSPERKRAPHSERLFVAGLLAIPVLISLAGVGVYMTLWAAGHPVSEAVEATWPRAVVSEKIIQVNHHEEVDGAMNAYDKQEEWTSVDTAHYHMLNSSFGASRLCPALTSDVVAREVMYSNELLDQLVSPELKEDIVIPRPTPELNTGKCLELTPAGDHFTYHGKTVAILSKSA